MTHELGHLLLMALGVLAVVSWTSALILALADRDGPRIWALRERAGAAVVIAIVLSFGVINGLNTESGFLFWPFGEGIIVTRLLLLLLGLVPLRWVLLYWRGKL
jgi:hypothetical protein